MKRANVHSHLPGDRHLVSDCCERALGIREYREVFLKPTRIIYRIIEKKVYILLIADGRRDMDALLQRRLLG